VVKGFIKDILKIEKSTSIYLHRLRRRRDGRLRSIIAKFEHMKDGERTCVRHVVVSESY